MGPWPSSGLKRRVFSGIIVGDSWRIQVLDTSPDVTRHQRRFNSKDSKHRSFCVEIFVMYFHHTKSPSPLQPGASGSSGGPQHETGGSLPGQRGDLAPRGPAGALHAGALASAGPVGARGWTTGEGAETRFDVLLQVVWKVGDERLNSDQMWVKLLKKQCHGPWTSHLGRVTIRPIYGDSRGGLVLFYPHCTNLKACFVLLWSEIDH